MNDISLVHKRFSEYLVEIAIFELYNYYLHGKKVYLIIIAINKMPD